MNPLAFPTRGAAVEPCGPKCANTAIPGHFALDTASCQDRITSHPCHPAHHPDATATP